MSGLSWVSIIRLGLVQAALGSIVVLTTSTLNRVLVVELSLPALIPGFLVGLHYGVQLTRPLWGHASDGKSKRTPFILAGIVLLALSGTGAAATTVLFEYGFWLAFIAAIIFFIMIGIGIGAAGTSLLALLATYTAPSRRAAAATLTWILMIVGIVITAIVSSFYLDPYSHQRLITVTALCGVISIIVSSIAVWNIESKADPFHKQEHTHKTPFKQAIQSVWNDRSARIFTVFVFFSMLAFQTQDLILEPFGGFLFDLTPGQTTRLSGTQHSGVLLGMAVVGILGTALAKRIPWILKLFTVSGCLGSAFALAALAYGAKRAPHWPLEENIALLGFANGIFAVAAIGTMMSLASAGRGGQEGLRMGVWGAAQAVAFGLGSFLGTIAIDVMRYLTEDIALSFATVFAGEAILFLISALIALAAINPYKQTHKSRSIHVQPAE